MLILLLAGVYATLLPLGFGIWFLRIVRACLRLTDKEPVAALTAWLGGLVLLTILLEIWSLAGPLHTAAHWVAASIGAAGLAQPAGRQLLRRQLAQARQLHGSVQALGILLILCVLVVSTMPPINIDTGYYHAQSVRWLEEMGIVPGLANIELHIGFNSAWFVPEALFSWGRYVGSPLQVLNPVFFVLFGWYGLGGLDKLLKGRFWPADLVRPLLTVVIIFWLLDDLPSLSPDPAVTLLVFFIVVQSLVLPWPRPGQPLTTAQVAVVVLSLFAVTVKLSTLPILLLPMWWVGRSGQLLNRRFMLVMSSLALAIVGPWLVRNVLLSGYLVFPVAAIDLFNPSWKFPTAELRLHNDYIKEFARNADFYNQISVHNKPWQFWLPIWWRQQFGLNKVVLLAVPTLLLASLPLGWWQYRRGRLPQGPQLLVALAVALSGLLFWFALAPAFRFGYGFVFTTLALLLLPWLWAAARRGARVLAIGTSLAIAGLLLTSPLLVEYRHYVIPPTLSPAEYASLLRRVATPTDQAFLRSQFPGARRDTIQEKPGRSARERVRLIGLLARIGGLKGRSGLDGVTGRSGLLGLAQRLVWPAPYPVIQVQALPLPPEQLLQSQADQLPWYAPFPFAARRELCEARGGRLADGFLPRPKARIRNWRREARW